MKIKTLKSNSIKYIDRIYHIGDVHIRNLKRHKEYKQVFKRLYSYIEATKTDTSIIYVAGDVVHSKTDLSPELVSMLSDFFTSLCALCPTIVITGNHDCNLNNASRMDAISPIIDAINNKNIYYLRDTGLYKLCNVTFNVMSVFDSPSLYINGAEFTDEYKIALHHGAVHNSVTDLGAVLTNTNVNNSIFNNHDLVLLGDIHKRQILQTYRITDDVTYPSIAYPGSLIQQNHAESLDHGILVWNLPARKCEYIQIKNDYGYYTINIEDNVIINWIDEIPARPRIRIRVGNTDPASLNMLIAEIKRRRKVEELTIQKINVDATTYRENKTILSNVRDVEVQNDLIADYITNKFPDATSDDVDGIRHINRTINSKLDATALTRNITWIPKRFEFSNMFSYGENNVVDMTDMRGMYGLFAGNTAGKSTLLDSLLFCCFDKCTRTTKATHVLNNKKDRFSCKFTFELNGVDYCISRTGIKDKHGHVRVLVDFSYIDDAGDVQLLNGEERDDTNRIIRSYIGTYEDFIMTSFSTQRNNSGFIDSKQSARKDLLSIFLDINIFDSLYNIANEQIKQNVTLYKEYTSYDYPSKLVSAKSLLSSLTNKLNDIHSERQETQQLLNQLSTLIIQTTGNKKHVDPELRHPEDIKRDIEALRDANINLADDIIKLQSDIDAKETKHSALQLSISDIDLDSLYAKLKLYTELNSELSAIRSKIAINNTSLAHHEGNIEALHHHEYDPNCKYCIRNKFVTRAEESKHILKDIKAELITLQESESIIISKIDDLHGVDLKIRIYNDTQSTAAELLNLIEKLKSKKTIAETTINTNLLRLEALNSQLRNALLQEDNILFNDDIDKQLDALRLEYDEAQHEMDELTDELNTATANISVCNANIQSYLAGIEKLRSLDTEIRLYEYYLDSISRDGVPYQLIERAMPQLELEINNILSQVVDFNIVLNTDGKNINAYIVYDTDNYWPIELISGMERFITSIAIRVALINISTLPRTNFLIIDEGLGNLDSTMLNSIGLMFDYLKSQFQFVWLISHIDVSRDIVDHIIELSKENGISKIQYE